MKTYHVQIPEHGYTATVQGFDYLNVLWVIIRDEVIYFPLEALTEVIITEQESGIITNLNLFRS